ncbi:MAG: T9SS type A sorting domain-containing protein [Bacteroidia bacterium]|jgi:hypothetical protein|nr:T9SS type A sorting domain-containing protein [Bacteroidia bacterium]
MKKSFFLLLLTGLFALPVLGQSTFTVYGLARNFSPAQLYLATVQPANGGVNEISPSSIAQGYVLNPLSAIDPVTDRFYFSPGMGTLLAVDLNTGLADTITLNIPFTAYFDLMQYNCGDSTLYGIYRTSSPAECYLAKADVNTGQVTIISPNSIATGFSLTGKSTLDPFNNIFYFFSGAVSLIGLDLTTGLPVVQTNVSFTGPGQYFDLMSYNCDDGVIYGVSRNSSPGAIYPASLDVATGVVTNLSSTSMGQGILLNAMSEINPFAGLFHFSNGSSFVTYDIVTGNVVASPALSFSPSPGNIYFDMIARDNCKCIFSNPNLDVEETPAQRGLKVFPSPLTQGENLFVESESEWQAPRITVLDALGKVVALSSEQHSATRISVNTSGLQQGLYFILVEDESGVIRRAMFSVL